MLTGERRARLWRLLLWFGVAALLSLRQWCAPLGSGVPVVDVGRYLTVAQGWADGLLPYRDLFDHKGPLTYIFHLFALFGGGQASLWLLCLLWVTLCEALTFKIARIYVAERSATVTACLMAVMLCAKSDNSDTVELIGLPFVGVALLALLRPLHEGRMPSARGVFATALAVFLAMLTKANEVISVVLPALVVICKVCRPFNTRLALRYLAAVALAGALTLGPVVAYFAWHGALAQFVDANWTFNVEYSNFPFPFFWRNFIKFGLLLPLPFYVAGLWLLCDAWGDPQRRRPVALVSVNALGSAIGIMAMSWGNLHNLAPAFFALLLVLALAIERLRLRSGLLTAATALCVAAPAFAQPLLPKVDEENRTVNAPLIARYVSDNTRPDDKIVVYNSSLPILALAHRHSASRLFYQHPLFMVRQAFREEFADDVRRARPRLLIVGPEAGNDLPDDVMQRYEKDADFEMVQVLTLKP